MTGISYILRLSRKNNVLLLHMDRYLVECFMIRSGLHLKPEFTLRGLKKFQQKYSCLQHQLNS